MGSEPAPVQKSVSETAEEEADMDIMWALVVILAAMIVIIGLMIVMSKKKAKINKANADTIENAEEIEEEEVVIVEENPSPVKKSDAYEPPMPDGKLREVEII